MTEEGKRHDWKRGHDIVAISLLKCQRALTV